MCMKMRQSNKSVVLLVCYLCFADVTKSTSDLRCDVRMRVESGWVCGLRRLAENNVEYASFRGIPYAQQPVGQLRFKELQPVRPWPHHLDATEEGSVCPQHDELYDRLVTPYRGMSEACIYANVHVPIDALLAVRSADENHYQAGYDYTEPIKGLPIFVFVHGGGFQAGSGDTDLHGPEYLVSKGIIVITFNYRINVFGFLSLKSPKIPGNNGLRDQITLLRWVQKNAKAFGGDPNDVTLGGQSAGAACAHLLSLSKATKGLFKRVILMSGTAIPTFYTSSPVYASTAATRFLTLLGINSTDPDVIHDQLVNTPLKDILNANSAYQYESGLTSFTPVVEAKYPGVTRVLDDEPTSLIKQGRGKDLPLIVGFTDAECEFFRRRLLYLDILRRIKENPLLILPLGITFSTAPNVALVLAKQVIDRYFHEKLTIDEYLYACRDTLFAYPSFKVSEWRAEMNAAPVYLYQFSYESYYSVVKAGLGLQYAGSAHLEDLTFIFRENAILGEEMSFPPRNRDDLMKAWMTQFVVNFMRCNEPSCDEPAWLPVHAHLLNYQKIQEPAEYCNMAPTEYQHDMIKFFDEINKTARNSSVTATTSAPSVPSKGEFLPFTVVNIDAPK